MTRHWKALRLTLLLALAVAALAALPTMALAAVTITGGTIDGKSRPPPRRGASSLPPRRVRRTGVDTWRGTRYRFGSENARARHRRQEWKRHGHGQLQGDSSAGSRRPRPRSEWEHVEQLLRPGTEKVLPTALNVLAPGANPTLPPRCGINVMLVLDESGSIGSSRQTDTVRNATRAFLTALSGTGALVSIVDFSSTAAQPVPYTQVTRPRSPTPSTRT